MESGVWKHDTTYDAGVWRVCGGCVEGVWRVAVTQVRHLVGLHQKHGLRLELHTTAYTMSSPQLWVHLKKAGMKTGH